MKAAVISGMHPCDVPDFIDHFYKLPDVDSYTQTLDNFVMEVGCSRKV